MSCPIYRLGNELYGDATGLSGISYTMRQLTCEEARQFVSKVIESKWYMTKRAQYGVYPDGKPFAPEVEVVFSDVVQAKRGFVSIATCQRVAWVKPQVQWGSSWTTRWRIIVWALRGSVGARRTVDTHTLLHEICHTIDMDAAYSGCQRESHSAVFVDNLAEAEQIFGDLGGRQFRAMLKAHGIRRAGPRRRETLMGRVHVVNSALRIRNGQYLKWRQ